MTRQKANRTSVLMLAAGCAMAAAVYFAAPAPAPEQPYDPLAARKYNRQLQRIGGKANVMAAEFDEWFASIWHGRRLAGTIVVLTLGATATFRALAMSPEDWAAERREVDGSREQGAGSSNR